jgi:hypothetical protein
MAKRATAGREQGFFKRIVGDEGEEENNSLMLDDGLMDNDVFEVERVVERRRRKVCPDDVSSCSS